METKAKYAVVGATVLLIFAAAVAFVAWMGADRSSGEVKNYWIDFEGSVSGLREGSSVAYRGITVGSVTDLRIRPDNVELVRVTIEIDAATPIKTDTTATMQLKGLAGGALIQLSGGTQAADPIPEPAEGLPLIASAPSSIDQLVQGAPELIDRVDALVTRATLLLDERNLRAIAAVIANAEKVSAQMAAAADPAGGLMVDVQQAAEALRQSAQGLDKLVQTSEQQIATTAASAQQTLATTNEAMARAIKALESFESAGAQFDEMIAENRGPIRDFTNVTLYDTNALIAEMRELMVSLRQFTNELNRNPSGFFLGNSQRGYDAK